MGAKQEYLVRVKQLIQFKGILQIWSFKTRLYDQWKSSFSRKISSFSPLQGKCTGSNNSEICNQFSSWSCGIISSYTNAPLSSPYLLLWLQTVQLSEFWHVRWGHDPWTEKYSWMRCIDWVHPNADKILQRWNLGQAGQTQSCMTHNNQKWNLGWVHSGLANGP